MTDTGIGISPDAQPLIFSKFAQADNSTTRKYGGTGLGLPISEQLVALLDGEIGFDSIEGEGSTFWFTIRCAPGDPKAVTANIFAREIEDFQPERTVRSLNILVAEDNVVNQAVIRALLDKAGHRFEIVGNGVEAVSAVMRTQYDLILMDVQMPEMDGVTATQRIQSLPGAVQSLPIIALTANAMKGDREMYLEAGMTDYVSKPIKPGELMAAIARSGAQAEAVNDDRDHASKERTSVDETPVLDQDVLDNLSEAVGEETMPELVGRSADEMRANIARIEDLGNAADFAAVQREAHDLKSTSGGFGAARLQRLAQALELACKEDREQDARQLVTEIVPVAQEAFEALEAKYVPRSTESGSAWMKQLSIPS